MSYVWILFFRCSDGGKEAGNSYCRPHCITKNLINPSNSIQNGQLRGKMQSFNLIILHDTLSLSQTPPQWKRKELNEGRGRFSLRSTTWFLLAPKYVGSSKAWCSGHCTHLILELGSVICALAEQMDNWS